ncbi:hypothetical protein PMI38_01658, partial [Pseudomonas sp. GM84]
MTAAEAVPNVSKNDFQQIQGVSLTRDFCIVQKSRIADNASGFMQCVLASSRG